MIPPLRDDDVHVWFAHAGDLRPLHADLERLLCDAERSRAREFREERDGRRYALAHGVLRWLLGVYCGVPARELRFAAGPFGKPYLDHPAAGPGLAFNLSHSGDRVAIAIARRAVGVDVQRVCVGIDAAVWTRTEALLKARGAGLASPARSHAAGDRPVWGIRELDPGPGYAAAVAARGDDWRARALRVDRRLRPLPS